MRSSVGAVSLLALARLGVTHGDAPCLSLTSKIPDCALSCVKSAASAVGCTDPSDLSCQCEPASKEAILVTAQGCVMGCGMDQVLAAIDGGSAICDCVATATPPSVPVFTSAEPVYTTPPTLPSETSTPTQHTDSSAPPKETSKLPPYANTTAPTTQSFQPPAQSSAPPDSTQTQSTVRVVSSASPDRPPTSCLSEGSGESTATSEGPVTSSLVGGTTTAPCVPGSKSDCGAIATSAVPKCAQECFSSNVPKVGCDVTDYACQCQPAAQQSLSSFLVPCVATACPQAAIPSVIAGASQVCACATAPPSGGDCTATEGTDKTIVKTETLIATVTSCATGTQEPPKPTEGKPCLPGDDCGQHSTTTVVEPPASRPTESEKPGSEHSTGGHSVGPEPSCSTPGDVAPQPSCGNHSSCGGGGGGGGQQTGGHSEHPQPSASPTGGNPVVPKRGAPASAEHRPQGRK
ncbi:hypothetical protein CDD83_7744 [Cordyceps sp. RAO-2017]|nr:hypothetical protein CDD83_7744 [Cordyceps sp. RAO-2017]